MTLGEVIRRYREERGLSMDEFSKKSSLSKAYISILERNVNPSTGRPVVPSLETIKAVASVIGLDVNDLIDVLDGDQPIKIPRQGESYIPDGFQPMPDMAGIPLVGRIACGEPITAEQNVEGIVSVPAQWHSDFALLCQGDSMEPSIKDGDLVAIHIQPMVENGEIAAVRIDNEATLKHVYLYKNYIELRPENPAYQSIIKIGEEMNEVKIEGKAVGLCRGM